MSFKILEQSQSAIFYAKPDRLQVNEEARSNYASSQKIETLIQELGEKGPMVGLAKLGPKSYTDKPTKFDEKMGGEEIYGWKKGAVRLEHSPNSAILILGAKKTAEREYVFFTLSDDITPDQKTLIRSHRVSSLDNKVYVTSHLTFANYINDLYPPVELNQAQEEVSFTFANPAKAAQLTAKERQFAARLCEIKPLDSILDQGAVEARCKAIGQEIFNYYKLASSGNSGAGFEAARKICDAIKDIATDGRLRKQYIERAWDGLGDNEYTWMS